MNTPDDEELTDFEQWALRKGYDISFSTIPTKENVVTYADPITLAAYEGWCKGFMKGLRSPLRADLGK
jgi:hypothetical protein